MHKIHKPKMAVATILKIKNRQQPSKSLLNLHEISLGMHISNFHAKIASKETSWQI